jgi:hypothetical protein
MLGFEDLIPHVAVGVEQYQGALAIFYGGCASLDECSMY